MDYPGVRQYVLDSLRKNLRENLFYHGLHHTIDVCNAVEELSAEEKIAGDDLEMLRTAAIMHDLGFVEQYLDNEPIAVRLAKKILPSFGYSPSQIEVIARVILCTQIPQKPSTHLEKIMCDADLDYLGRDDFFEISETLKKEWLEYNLIQSDEEYNIKQVRFFERHRYFTDTAKRKREAKKQQHLTKLKEALNGH